MLHVCNICPVALLDNFNILDEESDKVIGGASSNSQAAAVEGMEGESVFCKLEKTRTALETTLGLASLLEAYQLIQVYTQ